MNKPLETQASSSVHQSPHISSSSNSQDIINENEIDLIDLLIRLKQQLKLIISLSALGLLLSIIIAFLIPSTYQHEVLVSLPTSADVSSLNTNGYGVHSAKSVFKRYYNELRSTERITSYILDNNYLALLFPENDDLDSKVLSEFLEDFDIEILEYLGEDNGKRANNISHFPARIAIKAEHTDERALAKFINGYVQFVGMQVKNLFRLEQALEIDSQLHFLENKLQLLRAKAAKERKFLIARLEEENSEAINENNSKLSSLEERARLSKSHELVVVNEAFEMAKKLNIEKPVRLWEFGRDKQELSTTTEINLNEDKDTPLYLMGTIYLKARLDQLNAREDDIPFIEEYASIKEKISLLERDPKLLALKAREVDDPFIEELPKLVAEKQRLERLSLDFDSVQAYRLDKKAQVTGVPKPPSKILVILIGFLVSIFFALLVGILAGAVKNREG